MHRLMNELGFPSLHAAAWEVAPRAYGGATRGSKAKRLARTYFHTYPEAAA
jgi:hypothetical protein